MIRLIPLLMVLFSANVSALTIVSGDTSCDGFLISANAVVSRCDAILNNDAMVIDREGNSFTIVDGFKFNAIDTGFGFDTDWYFTYIEAVNDTVYEPFVVELGGAAGEFIEIEGSAITTSNSFAFDEEDRFIGDLFDRERGLVKPITDADFAILEFIRQATALIIKVRNAAFHEYTGELITADGSCSSTFVLPDVILTAAQCVADADPISVEVSLGWTENTQVYQIASFIEDTIIHPFYTVADDAAVFYDVALIFLDREIYQGVLPNLANDIPELGEEYRFVSKWNNGELGYTTETASINSIDSNDVIRTQLNPREYRDGDIGGVLIGNGREILSIHIGDGVSYNLAEGFVQYMLNAFLNGLDLREALKRWLQRIDLNLVTIEENTTAGGCLDFPVVWLLLIMFGLRQRLAKSAMLCT